ncbi:MAG: shikimate dehydrogenase [Clostridia bacterium]|nr:shikimate dehydrogenase [Clostridia bacterium]
MLKLAVIGKDVSQSQSPSMHTFILKRMGHECSYDSLSIPPAQFSARAEKLFQEYDAFNVTIPFKLDIIPYLKELRGDAPAFGAVNTVLTRERTGYNTDGYGFLLMLENAGVQVAGKTVLVLGAGGAGRSCIKKLSDAGAEVFAYERDFNRIENVHKEIGGFTPLKEVPLRAFDIILNCTGIGMHDTVGQTPAVALEGVGTAPVDEKLLSLCSAAVDLIYVPEESEFLHLARGLGKPTVNGASMLFYQAYMADCLFLNKTPNAEEAKLLWQDYRKTRENKS